MKKLLSAITALALCGLLTACGNNTSSDGESVVSEATTAAETTVAETTSETAIADNEGAVEETAATIVETTDETTAEAATTIPETEASEVTEISEETTATETTATTTVTETEPVQDEPDESAEEEIVADDSDDDVAVNSKFADMDEFLAADIFMIEGKATPADKTLSANIFSTLKGDFYLEISEFDGSAPFRFAVKGDKIMTESEADGKTNKMIIRDSKAYTFDHENKVALFIPAEKELVSEYNPEKMGIVPKNVAKESFVVADVTIGDKAYKFEYGTTSDWAMLYNTDGKLYASVKSSDSLDCVLNKFSVTSKIPSDAFTIPEDYFQLDLEEMMQNAPPEEAGE